MERDVESVERVVLQMADRLARLEARVAALESAGDGVRERDPENEAGSGAPPLETVTADGSHLPLERPDLVRVLALCGRTFLILGGAYLLRALTQTGTLSSGVGVAFALLYAAAWLVVADRAAGRRGDRLTAQMYGVAATLIAFPVIVEAVERFGIFDGTAAVAILAVVTTVGFAMALRRRLEVVAWAVTLGALGVVMWMFLRASSHLPTTGFAIALGVATAVIARTHGWAGPRWPAAVVADVMVLVVAQVASREVTPAAYADVTPMAAVALAVALVGVYLAVVAVPTLVAKGGVSAFDAVQVPVALVVGVGSVTLVVRAKSLGGSIVGGLCVALGFCCYGVAFMFVDRRLGRNRTFFFYTSLGLLLVLAGVMLPASRGTAAVVWGLVGLVMATMGGTWNRITLRVHAAVFLCGAALAAGLGQRVIDSFGGHHVSAAWLVGSAGAVLVMLVVGYVVLAVTDRRRDVRWNGRLPRFAVLLPAVAGLGAAAVVVLAIAWPGGPPRETVEAGIRGVVLSVAAIALAAAARREAVRELGWLVYPLLIVTGLRLLVVDLRLGSPSELVVSFGAFGIALIAAPGLLRRATSGEAAADPSDLAT